MHHQPSLIDTLHTPTIMQFNTRLISRKIIRLSILQDAENSLEHGTFLDIQKFSMWLRIMVGKALRVPLKT